MRKRVFYLGIILVMLVSTSVFAAGKTEFVTCNENGELLNTIFSKATITVSGVDTSGNYIYKGIDIGVFKKGQTDSVYQKRVLTDTLKVQIVDFGDTLKYNSSDLYIMGYRVLYSLIDNEEGAIIETDWKMVENNYFKLQGTKEDLQFNDVDKSHWVYDALQYMIQKNVISGYDDGTFKPNEKITREQFAKLLILSYDIPLISTEKPSYNDVSKEDWSYNYIETAKPYIEGFKARNKLYFRRNSNITREQAISAIVKIKGLSAENVDTNELSVFNDYKAISIKYTKDILIAYKNKLVSGDEGNIKPKEGLTRAEAVALLYRIAK